MDLYELSGDIFVGNIKYKDKQIIVGGHSKGGNLALVASMHANILVRTQIREVLNADGPGLLDIEFYSKEFKKVLPKYKTSYLIWSLRLNSSPYFIIMSALLFKAVL